MSHVVTCTRTATTLFVAGIVAIGMSCVLLLDDPELEDTQQYIQHVAAAMLVMISVNQELMNNSGEDDDHDDKGTDKDKHKYYHCDQEWARQNIQPRLPMHKPYLQKCQFLLIFPHLPLCVQSIKDSDGREFFIDSKCDVVGHEPISLDVELMVSLKLLVFGVVILAWEDCFQMGSSNRSLPSWTHLAVLWQMCHVWITAWSFSGSVLVTGRQIYPKQKSTILHVFRWFHGCSTMSGTPTGRLVGLS